MAEAKAVVDNNEKVKKLMEEKVGKRKWALIGALVVLMVAVSLTLKHSRDNKSCHCSQDSRKYTGIVEDCCCDYETIDSVNEAVLHPLLQELVKTPFFRYFKVKLWCDCPFWPDDGMCKLRDCSVCECPENEFPEPIKKAMLNGLPLDDLKCQEETNRMLLIAH